MMGKGGHRIREVASFLLLLLFFDSQKKEEKSFIQRIKLGRDSPQC